MKPLIIASQMQPASRLKDDSVTLKFVTAGEVSTDLFTEIDAYRRVNGWLAFSPDQARVEIPNVRAVADSEMSPSKELRALVWRLWKFRGEKEAWETFYPKVIGKFGQMIIDLLEA